MAIRDEDVQQLPAPLPVYLRHLRSRRRRGKEQNVLPFLVQKATLDWMDLERCRKIARRCLYHSSRTPLTSESPQDSCMQIQ